MKTRPRGGCEVQISGHLGSNFSESEKSIYQNDVLDVSFSKKGSRGHLRSTILKIGQISEFIEGGSFFRRRQTIPKNEALEHILSKKFLSRS